MSYYTDKHHLLDGQIYIVNIDGSKKSSNTKPKEKQTKKLGIDFSSLESAAAKKLLLNIIDEVNPNFA